MYNADMLKCLIDRIERQAEKIGKLRLISKEVCAELKESVDMECGSCDDVPTCDVNLRPCNSVARKLWLIGKIRGLANGNV